VPERPLLVLVDAQGLPELREHVVPQGQRQIERRVAQRASQMEARRPGEVPHSRSRRRRSAGRWERGVGEAPRPAEQRLYPLRFPRISPPGKSPGPSFGGANPSLVCTIETADVVLMRSDPLDVATAISIGRGTLRKMRQNLGWAIGYNSLALPTAAGVFEPWGLTLRPEIAAISMSGSSVLVAVNALTLKRLRLAAHGR
jgi:hypothetical protein